RRWDKRGDGDRDVDEEDPSPVDVGDDRPADGRSGQRRQPGDTTPEAEGRAASLRRKDRGEDGEGLWGEQRAADALQHMRADELDGVLRQTAQRPRDAQDKEPDRTRVSMAVEVARTTGSA